MGIERIAMRKYGVDDLLLFFDTTSASCDSLVKIPYRWVREFVDVDLTAEQRPSAWSTPGSRCPRDAGGARPARCGGGQIEAVSQSS